MKVTVGTKFSPPQGSSYDSCSILVTISDDDLRNYSPEELKEKTRMLIEFGSSRTMDFEFYKGYLSASDYQHWTSRLQEVFGTVEQAVDTLNEHTDASTGDTESA